MRFTKPFWAGIADGSVTVAFRRWRRPTVVAGRPYRTGGGRIEVISVDVVDPASITDDEARRAGHGSAAEIQAWLDDHPGADDPSWAIHRVTFRVLDEPDPRERLAADAGLTDDDVAEIDGRLDRLDRASSSGPWTRQTLALIAERPETRAPDLAATVGRETQPFKLDVRKLKNLGLTTSLAVGYSLSPRGRAYLDRTAAH
ncbi:MAG: hypothetical protein ACFCVK_03840 [Acidimicrobiales bacterium]